MMEHDDRVEITIPFPSYIPRARGPYAVGKFGTKIKSMCTVEEKDLLVQACDYIGISQADFIRWCVTHVARKVLKDVEVSEQVEA